LQIKKATRRWLFLFARITSWLARTLQLRQVQQQMPQAQEREQKQLGREQQLEREQQQALAQQQEQLLLFYRRQTRQRQR
jgi:hypothetical protein